MSLHPRVASGLSVRKGEEIKVDAYISGSPYPTFIWLRNDENVRQEAAKKKPDYTVKKKKKTKTVQPEPEEEFHPPLLDRLSYDQSKRGETALMIRDAIRTDHGKFTIRVENAHGVATASCDVNVLGKLLSELLLVSA